MLKKRVKSILLFSLVLFAFGVFFNSVSTVSAVDYYQGSNVIVNWHYGTQRFYNYITAICSMSVWISGPGWNDFQESSYYSAPYSSGYTSGAFTFNIPSNVLGTYEITNYVECSDDPNVIRPLSPYARESQGLSTSFNVVPVPDNAPIGSVSTTVAGSYPSISFNGWAQDADCSGTVTQTSNNCPLDIHVYMDGPAGSGATGYSGTVANLVVGSSNKDNYIWYVPTQYLDGQQHIAYSYALGKDSSGNNNGNNLFLGTTKFTISPTCSSFTYSGWSACYDGSWSRTVSSSSPQNCVGGNPATSGPCSGTLDNHCTSSTQCASGYICSSNLCKVSVGNSCSSSTQCASGLYCKTSTGTCTDPNNEHYACSNNQCLLVAGSGSNTCSIDANCQTCSYSTTYSCSVNTRTTTITASPNGCIGSSSSSSTTCTYGCSSDGINCNSAPSCTYTPQYSCSANIRTKTYSSSPLNCVGTAPADSGSSTTCTYGCSSDGINCKTGLYGTDCSSSTQCASGLICSLNTCKVAVDNHCTSTSECASGLYCKTSTGTCTDPNNEHLACSNNQCVLVAGSGSGTCSMDANCQACTYTYSGWSSCVNFQQTRTLTSASPQGCYGSPVLSQTCDPCEGVTCNAPPNNLCYSPSGSCLSGSCSYVKLAPGTSCGTDQVCNTLGDCGISQPIDSASWNSLNSQSINSGEVYDTFRMVASGVSLAGRTVEFKLYKDELIDNLVSTQTSTTGYSDIQINVSGDYFFTASVIGSPASEVKSSTIPISSVANNAPPIVSILNPAGAGIYFVNSPVSLQENSYDSDDSIVSKVWTFSDGGSFSGSSGTYSFTTEGQKTIKLKVTDSRGAYAESTLEIMIVDTGVKLVPYIYSPKNKNAVVSKDLVLDYSAQGSFAIDVVNSGGCTYTINCIAGTCPISTQNAPSCSGSTSIPISGTPKGYDNLEFNWTFREGNKLILSKKSVGIYSGSIAFANPGLKNVSLKLTYTNSVTSTTSNEVNLFNLRQCSSAGSSWYDIQNGFIIGTHDTLSSSYCAGLDNSAGTNDDCCPAGYYCSTSGSAGCLMDLNSDGSLPTCSDYVTQQSCESDSSQRVKNELLWSYSNCAESVNGNNSICRCSWKSSSNSCMFTNSFISTGDPLSGELSECSYTSQSNACVDGYMTVQVQATLSSGVDPSCVSSTQVLPCGKPVIALPFFGMTQFILSIVGVFVIYGIFSRFVSRK